MTRTTAQNLAQFRTELIEGGFDDVDTHTSSEVFQLVKMYAQANANSELLVVGEEKPAKVSAGPFSLDERPAAVRLDLDSEAIGKIADAVAAGVMRASFQQVAHVELKRTDRTSGSVDTDGGES